MRNIWKHRIPILLTLMLMCFNIWANAQIRTKVSGIIIDAATEEPLPFVNLIFVIIIMF